MPRFVIHEHDYPHLHWDLMLEAGEALRTWRLAEPPMAGATVAAEALADHRREYLDYEGPVSGNRGQVRRWDWGTYEGEMMGARIAVLLHGERTTGLGVLTHISEEHWLFQLVEPDTGVPI